MPQKLDIELQDFMFVLLDFGLAFVLFLISMPPFFPLGMGKFALCHRTLEVSNSFDFYKNLEIRDCFESQ
jgi:hypothetical protein